MVAECPCPGDVYVHSLDCYLLLSCLASLLRNSTGRVLPPAYSMLSRNDIIQAARDWLPDLECYDCFLQYSMVLSAALPPYASPATPAPIPCAAQHVGSAEMIAQQILHQGSCSLWEAVRQVACELPFELPRHRSVTSSRARSFTIGIYGRQQLVGICKETLPFSNVCRLLNSFVLHLCSGLTWTTIAIHLDYDSPVHLDVANGPEPNLVVLLSTTEQGGLWIQDEGGSHYMEDSDKILRGRIYSLQDQYLVFPAHQRRHATQAWGHYNRFTLVAYTVRNWRQLAEPMQRTLHNLGFMLPARPEMAAATLQLLSPTAM